MYTPSPGLKIFLNMNAIDSLPTYISSLSKTVKRKPLIFNFKWNFDWILGQHDILVLGDVPTPTPESENFFYLKLDLSLLMYPPPFESEKISIRS